MTTAPETQTPATAPERSQMHAVVQDHYGSPDDLEVRTVPMPTVAPDEVLVEVYAAGLDRGVWHLVRGLPYLVRVAGFGVRRPKNPVPGLDVAGVVAAVGADVTRFRTGDEVFGIAQGAFAEYAVAKEAKLAPKPSTVDFEQAGVAAVSGITALQALTRVGQLQAGQSVLVIGASGGVGSYAVQLAKALGGHVTGISGTRGTAMVRSLGADRVIDYTQQDFVDEGQRYDLILDIGGRNSLRRLRRALAPRGTLVIVGGEGGNRLTGGIGRQLRAVLLSLFVRQRLTTFISTEDQESIERLGEHMEQGDVTPAVGTRYRLDEVATAIRAMETEHAHGKAVVVVRPG